MNVCKYWVNVIIYYYWFNSYNVLFVHNTIFRFKHKNPEDSNEVPNGFLSDINPQSKKEIVGYIDASLARSAKVFEKFQFERIGFFSVDPDTTSEKVIITMVSNFKYYYSY